MSEWSVAGINILQQYIQQHSQPLTLQDHTNIADLLRETLGKIKSEAAVKKKLIEVKRSGQGQKEQQPAVAQALTLKETRKLLESFARARTEARARTTASSATKTTNRSGYW